MYNPNLNPAYVPNRIQDIEPPEYFKPIVFSTLTTEDRALLERALAALREPMSWQEKAKVADAIQARLAQR